MAKPYGEATLELLVIVITIAAEENGMSSD